MNISPISLNSFKGLSNICSQKPKFIKQCECDSCTFSYKKTSRSKEEVFEKAAELKEEAEDCYGSINAESTFAPVGVQYFTEDYEDKRAYMTLNDTEDASGRVTGTRIMFEDGKVSEIKTYKTKKDKFLGEEKFYFDTKTGTLKKYTATTKEGYFTGVPVNILNKTQVAYEF